MQIETSPEAALPPDRAKQRQRLIQQAWPDTSDVNHDPALDPLSMLLVDEGIVLASLDILSKRLTHHGRSYYASGLAAVVTDQPSRHQGYGLALARAARLAMHNRRRDLALFTCDSYLSKFYLDAGFEILRGTVLIGGTPDAPLRSDQFDKVTFGAFYTTFAAAHRDDFINADIELYPGAIDRLW